MRNKKTYTACANLCVESKKAIIETKNGGMAVRGQEWENGKILVKGYKLSVIWWTSSGNLMYSMVTIVNNMVFYTLSVLRVVH